MSLDGAAAPGSPWATKGARSSLVVNVVGGLLLGYSIGFIAVILQFNQYFGDCARYTSESACSAMTDTGCEWVVPSQHNLTGNASCLFPNWRSVNCSEHSSQDSCKGVSSCYWQYHRKKCAHTIGWDANQQGILAGIQVIGAMISAPLAGPLADRFGRRWSIGMCGLCTLMACVFFTAGWQTKENYPMLVIAELLVGFSGGWVSVICPMYCGEMCAKELEFTIGVLFQVSLTFGIWLAALMGFALDPHTNTATPHVDLQVRLQYVIALQWATAAAFSFLPLLIPESSLWLSRRKSSSGDGANGDTANGGEGQRLVSSPDIVASESPPAPSTSFNLLRRDLIIPILVGVALAAAQQLTGINAIVLYAPQLVSTVNMQPLVANFYIMLWNFLTCCISVPLIRRFYPRQLYIGTTAIASVACLMTGFAVYPGMLADGSVGQTVLGAIGILVYVMAFECGIGPCFYVLAQDVFPEDVRSAGCSYIIWICFLLNVVINYGFPVAVVGFSGGPSGDQNLGMSVCFFIFGSVGFVTAAFLFFKMPQSNSEKRREAELLQEAEQRDKGGVAAVNDAEVTTAH